MLRNRAKSLLCLHSTQRPSCIVQSTYHYSAHSNKSSKIGIDDCDKFHHGKQNGDCGEQKLQLHKSKGQHLLTNQRVLDTIVRKSDARPTDTVLEIGPGTGNLTLKLLQQTHKVVAIEVDKRMVEILNKRVSENGFQDRISVINKDALKTDFPDVDLVVANIPYGISSPLIAKLVFGSNKFRSATLLLQKEFARRLLANPGDSEFNRLAVNVKLVADVEFIMDVSKREFVPVPKVDSSVIKIWPKNEIPNVDLNEWLAFTRVCFSKKNKTLGATLKQKKKLIELLKLSFKKVVELDGGSTVSVDDDDIGAATDHCDIADQYVDEDDETSKNEELTSIVSPVHGGSDDMSLFKEKVIGILRSSGFEDKRPSKLSVEELIHLLALFNQHQIYFRDVSKDAGSVECAVSDGP